jgi:hypothetical protein
MQDNDNIIAIFFLFVCIFGILFVLSLRWLLRVRRLKNNGEIVYGQVVDIKKTINGDAEVFSAVIEYLTINGERERFVSEEGSLKCPELGETVVVLYNIDKPESAIEFNTASERNATISVSILGIVVALLLLAILTKSA